PYTDVEDVVRRSGITVAQAEALATAGAFDGFGLSRRQALWSAGALAAAGGSLDAGPRQAGLPAGGTARSPKRAHLPGLVTGAASPALPGMDPVERNRADLWALGLSPDSYPTEFIREDLTTAGIVTSAGLAEVIAGARVAVAGVVTHRQRPATAQGVVFVNLEDETGLINVICSRGVWVRFRRVARSQPALRIDGRLERVEGVINIVAERISPLLLPSSALRSRDFR
ncbi:MAG: OB-fold nucleic acid binding domain-containing protein, partial [Actinomycetota bacterium]|nr:OB-fold nucleic acid binding domain-containing protein [Actinomycetota bacterium]